MEDVGLHSTCGLPIDHGVDVVSTAEQVRRAWGTSPQGLKHRTYIDEKRYYSARTPYGRGLDLMGRTHRIITDCVSLPGLR